MTKEDKLAAGATAACGAVVVASLLWLAAKAPPPTVPSEAPGLESELRQCVKVLEDTQRSADFWRNAALEMRTEGVDSLRPVPER